MAGAAAASGRELVVVVVVVVVVSLGMEVMNTAAERWKKDRQAEAFVGSICLACKEQLGTQIRSRSGEGLKAEEGTRRHLPSVTGAYLEAGAEERGRSRGEEKAREGGEERREGGRPGTCAR
jgi:hypothetical protein